MKITKKTKSKVKKSFDEIIYEKLKEADEEMNNTKKRYTKEEVMQSLQSLIDYRTPN